jgi:uncharacterized protein YdhG (YjbR/CyaY superfamily)
MQSAAKDVDAYLGEVPEDRRAIVEWLISTCRQELSDFVEDMSYGMPSYSRDGGVEIAFASQKGYLSLYVLRQDVRLQHATELDALKAGKSCVRFHRPDQLDKELVISLLRSTASTPGQVC